jgi:competence ComEA-like helix-hairpin-helix protein
MKDFNTATQAELEQVPLISPTRAATIVNWRESHGPIHDMAKLTEIPGIGDRMVQRMAQFFTIGSEPSGDYQHYQHQPEENGGEGTKHDPLDEDVL